METNQYQINIIQIKRKTVDRSLKCSLIDVVTCTQFSLAYLVQLKTKVIGNKIHIKLNIYWKFIKLQNKARRKNSREYLHHVAIIIK